jgi:tetratricopeptide (TPR) repeat protein
MTLDEDPTEENRPDPQFRQTAVSNVQARDIQIGQIVQKIVYLGIPPNSPLRPFALVISIALYLTLLIVGFVLLWRDGAGFVPLLLLIVGSGLLSLTCLYYAWFWKPEVQDRSPLIPEGSLDNERVKRQRTKQRSRQQVRRLAIAGFFLIPLLTCAGFFGWRSLPPNNILLLVANFDGSNQQNYQVTETLLRNLRNATESYTDVKVQSLNQTITEQQGSDVARAEGAQKKAAIVIWGEYGVTSDHVQVSNHFEVLKPPTDFPKLETTARGEEQIAAIAELNSFKLQTHLSNEMNYLTLFTLGMVQYAEEGWESAIARFSDALDQVKEPVPILDQTTIYFYRGNSYLSKSDSKSAIADYNQALKLKPDYADAYINRGLAYINQGNYTQAIADYNQALKLKPDFALAYNNRALAYNQQGNYTQAIADYNQALTLKPDFALAYNNRALAYNQQGNYTQAIADYNQALKLKPDLAEAYYNRGSIYDNQGKYAQAIADYNQALTLKPDYAEAYINRGVAYYKQGNYTQAIADFNQALKLKPDYAEAHNNRGVAYYKQGNYTQAIADYNQALKLKPDYAEAYNNRGSAYDDQGNYIQAIADYNQALKLKPDYASAYYNKACAYSLNKEVKEAIENLQRAIRLDAKYQKMAKTDSDFNNIRKDQQFQALVGK